MLYYSKKLSPECSLRMARRVEDTRQKIIVTHNPSDIDQNHLLLITFLNLRSEDVIIPGVANLSLSIKLDSTDDKSRTLVSNIGRA